jgi:hypothetical protein
MKQVIESSWGEVKNISVPINETFWRSTNKIESSQIAQHPVFWRFEITATWDYPMDIGFVPSLLYIDAFEDWHAPYSHATLRSNYNICRYTDSGSNNAEATANTVVYLSHAGITSATIKNYGKRIIINCSSYHHDAIVHWQAYP